MKSVVQDKLLPDWERTPIPNTTWGKPQYIKVKEERQRIELSRGCPHNCDYCYAPTEVTLFPIPEIKRNYVEILDMNILYPREEMLEKISNLPEKLDDKKIKYDVICGYDYRVLDQDIIDLLYSKNFVNPKIAWDETIKIQYQIKDTIDMLTDAGYRPEDIGVFMLTNHEISYEECVRKLDILKVWNVRVCDCCYDGGYRKAVPEYWTQEEITKFRRKCRKHNQLVNFKADPEVEAISKDQAKLDEVLDTSNNGNKANQKEARN